MIKFLHNGLIAFMLFIMPAILFGQTAPDLKTTSNFVLFTAVGNINNVGASVVTGDIGTHVGAITGFPIPGTLIGTSHTADPAATQAATDVATAYAELGTVTCVEVLEPLLGNGQTLTPDVYCVEGAATLNGELILDAGGNPDAIFIFKINGALSSTGNVSLINGAAECNVYWHINGLITLGENAVFRGTAINNGAINLLIGSKLFGRALSTSGAINISDVDASLALCNVTLPVPTLTGQAAPFAQSTGNVYTTEAGMTNYVWAVSAGGTITAGGTSTSNTATVTWNTAGPQTVSVNYTDANGNTAVSPTVFPVTVVALPNPTITGPSPVCMATTANVYTTESGKTNYVWVVSAGGTITSGGTSTSNTSTVTWNTAGAQTVSVNYTDAYNNTAATPAVKDVTVNPLPLATITPAGDIIICEGGSEIISASAGSSYLWSTGETTKDITVTTVGNYSVTVTNANGCSGTSMATKVAVNPLPAATITSNVSGTICQGNSATLTASTNASYLWSTGETTQSISVTTAGDYSVVVTNICGKTNTSAVTTITVNPTAVVPTITSSGSTTICEGNSVMLTSSPSTSYLWNNGATTQSIEAKTGGNYTVTTTNENGCSATSAVKSVTWVPLSIATITSAATSFCEGSAVILTSSPGIIKWSTGETTQSITVKTAGDYFVTVTSGNGCSVTSPVTTISVNPMPVASITASGSTNICKGKTVTLTAASADSYLWSNGATSQSITVSEAGNYSVTVSNGIGCSATSAITEVTVDAVPVATITPGGDTSFCEGNSVLLTANAAGAYLWSNGETTQSITVTQSGDYTVNVFNTNQCDAKSASQTVTVYPLPVVSFVNPPVMVNIHNPSILLSAFPAGGIYSGAGVIGSLFNPSMAGLGKTQITYTYTNENNCFNSVSANIMVYDTLGQVCVDTVHVTVIDSVKLCVETTYETVYDTVFVSVTDTLVITVPITGIDTPNDFNTIKVYPNPTSSQVFINTGNYSDMNGYKLKITNSLGQAVFQNSIDQQLFNIDLSTLGTSGIYFIQVINPSSKVITTRKIVLQ